MRLSVIACCSAPRRWEEEETRREKQHRVFTYDEIEVATSGFAASSLLGRGSHGAVFLASLDGGRLLSAAKVPSQSSLLFDSRSPTDAEIDLLSSLPCSPLFVNLVGATSFSPRIAVVEFMPRGSLHDLLHRPLHPPPPFPYRLRLARLSAVALSQLHSLRVAHRDVKPANLLLGADGLPRLADFGLAVRLPGPGCLGAASLPPPAGTMGYLDPAYLRPEDVSDRTDVYSFGVVLLEVLSGREAINMEHSPPSLVDWATPLVAEGRFWELWDPLAAPEGKKEEEAAKAVAEIAAKCLAEDARRRPSMAEVAAALKAADSRVGPRRRLAGWGPRRGEDRSYEPGKGSVRRGEVVAIPVSFPPPGLDDVAVT
ncbi:serine/threonine-protein kinase-like protein At1g28390 [Curcuma longa]|uniref:serine/threonine-protein kinase-like protein At1g28390 n=1 Tax=Curcuma longa TaxID=136217 RepID=UPI003D9F3418